LSARTNVAAPAVRSTSFRRDRRWRRHRRPQEHRNALWRKGDREGAIAAFREAIRLEPGLAEAHFGLGHLLAKPPAAEREAWRAFWRGVDAVLAQASGSGAPAVENK
jgi:hypothetical protein